MIEAWKQFRLLEAGWLIGHTGGSLSLASVVYLLANSGVIMYSMHVL